MVDLLFGLCTCISLLFYLYYHNLHLFFVYQSNGDSNPYLPFRSRVKL